MIEFNLKTLQPPSESLIEYTKSIEGGGGDGCQRLAERFEITKPVPVIPVDDAVNPTGEPFMALTRNLSASGVSIMHTEAITGKFMVVELSSSEDSCLQVLVEVLRCRRRGMFFYEISGRSLRKLEVGI